MMNSTKPFGPSMGWLRRTDTLFRKNSDKIRTTTMKLQDLTLLAHCSRGLDYCLTCISPAVSLVELASCSLPLITVMDYQSSGMFIKQYLKIICYSQG